jgi:MSHA biogenesis protein MshK
MDEIVKRRMLYAVLLAALVALAGLLPTAAVAQALADPTRPPAALLNPVAASSAAAPATTAPRLQSILIARHPGGRHVAVIDGKTVRQGELVNGARLERMSQTEVVLVKGKLVQVLKLFPATASAGASPQR